MAVLGDDRCRRRAYRDLFVAFVALALEPDSLKPTRIYADGPWWLAARPRAAEGGQNIRRPEPTDCHHCHRPAHANIPGDHDYLAVRDFRPQPTPMPEQVRSQLKDRPSVRPKPSPKPPAPPVTETLAKHQPTEQEQS
jgi:hypothetical protein